MTRRLTLIVGLLIVFLSPWLTGLPFYLCGSIYGALDEWRHPETNVFEPNRWLEPDLKYRFSVAQEVVKNQIKPGMTEAEVEALLGKPDFDKTEGYWEYRTRRPGWGNFLGSSALVISFTEEKTVGKAYLSED